MRVCNLFLMLLLLYPVTAVAQRTAQDGVDSLRAFLQNGRITRIEILRDPDDVNYIVDITPDALRSDPNYKITFNDVRQTAFPSLLSEALPKASKRRIDLRWGILFSNAKGQEVGSIFVDHFGKTGYVNGEPVAFGSNLAVQLRAIIQHLR